MHRRIESAAHLPAVLPYRPCFRKPSSRDLGSHGTPEIFGSVSVGATATDQSRQLFGVIGVKRLTCVKCMEVLGPLYLPCFASSHDMDRRQAVHAYACLGSEKITQKKCECGRAPITINSFPSKSELSFESILINLR